MDYISSDLANKYFENILAIHRMNIEFYMKVTAIRTELEGMLALPELATGYNEKTGAQIQWLIDNKQRRRGENYEVESGFIPPPIVSGIIKIYDDRNEGYHEKALTYAAYLGDFDTMARAISFFSNMPIPQEIKAICDGNDAMKDQNDNKVQPSSPGQDTSKTYKIGDRGPAGGIVFYDKGNNIDDWRYLEVAPSNLKKAKWGLCGDYLDGNDVKTGFGKWNTELIVEVLNQRKESGMAAQLCKEYTRNGYNDWFLPSRDELNLLYVNLRKNNLGGFFDDSYWSSSRCDRYTTWVQSFSDGSQHNHNTGDAHTRLVRPIRAF